MLTTEQLDLRSLQERGTALARGERLGRAEDPWLASIDSLRPSVSISTADCAEEHRYLKSKEIDRPQKFHHSKAPYIRGIEDACDKDGVTVVAVKGPARGLKTTAFENRVFRNWMYAPSYEVIWFMQSQSDIEEYCEERLEPMLRIHDRINQHVNWRDRRHSLTRKRIRGQLARFLAATHTTFRSKTAPLIACDEIDGYQKRVRKGILALAKARQAELGLGGLLYLCSHPDAGPKDGIDVIIAQSLQHLWWVNCPYIGCRKSSSPAVEADVRMNWNVPQLLKDIEGMELRDILDMVERETKLICPHCQGEVPNDVRLQIMREGTWLQPHQTLDADGVVEGEALVERTMGFIIHGFMLPWGRTLGEVARDWVAAKINADETQDTDGLKEVICKHLGETFMGADDAEQMEDWKILQQRLTSDYPMGFVPSWVRFLTAFVDIQGDRFEVRVVGYGPMNESALIDCFAIKQAPKSKRKKAFQNIDPANRLDDWDEIEDAVINQIYPFVGNDIRVENGLPERFLPIAKTMIDAHGHPGVHLNAIRWVSRVTNPNRRRIAIEAGREARDPIALYRLQLTHGDNNPKGSPNERVKKHERDDKGQPLPHQVYERTINVHHYKLIKSRQMKIEMPGPGRLHCPNNMQVRYWREMAAERLINNEWVRFGNNETWDGLVSCEAAKDLLEPDRPEIKWAIDRPVWARIIEVGGTAPADGADVQGAPGTKSRYERMLDMAGKGDGEDDDQDYEGDPDAV